MPGEIYWKLPLLGTYSRELFLNRTFNYLLIITLLSSRSWQHSNMAIAALIYNRAHFASTLVLKHPVQGSGARAGKLPAPAHLVPFVAMLGRNGYYLRDGLD